VQHQIDTNEHMRRFYERNKFDTKAARTLSDIPPLHVSMFKLFDLRLCPKEQVVRTLKSSGTTGSQSIIPIDKATAFRQMHGLTSILKSYLGKERRPFLVLDTEAVNKSSASEITARGAAIRGFIGYSSDTCYALDGNSDEELTLNAGRVVAFLNKHKDKEVLAFGFTYIIWTMLDQLASAHLPKVKRLVLVHGGGWKKLLGLDVDKQRFNTEAAKRLSTRPQDVIDFYGMVEQTGMVFLDCSSGNKHVPDFGDIIVRDVNTMRPCGIGQQGFIELISILPNSYPGQAVLTEDIGVLTGIDNCGCGRKGKHFRFVSRAEKAEARGCGDTFVERVTA